MPADDVAYRANWSAKNAGKMGLSCEPTTDYGNQPVEKTGLGAFYRPDKTVYWTTSLVAIQRSCCRSLFRRVPIAMSYRRSEHSRGHMFWDGDVTYHGLLGHDLTPDGAHTVDWIQTQSDILVDDMINSSTLLHALIILPFTLQAQVSRKPKLIVILADYMVYGDIGCYGSPDVPTPHIDSISRNGVRCTDGYVSCAVCSPSRAALLTGRYQQRFGHEFNSGSIEREAEVGFGLPLAQRILPQYLKPAGYRSMAIGKWHLGARSGYHPLERGFDEFFGFLTGGNAFITKRTPAGHAVGSDGDGGKIPAERADTNRR